MLHLYFFLLLQVNLFKVARVLSISLVNSIINKLKVIKIEPNYDDQQKFEWVYSAI